MYYEEKCFSFYYIEGVIDKTQNNFSLRKNRITLCLKILPLLSDHTLAESSRRLVQCIEVNYNTVEIRPVFTSTSTIGGSLGSKIGFHSPFT